MPAAMSSTWRTAFESISPDGGPESDRTSRCTSRLADEKLMAEIPPGFMDSVMAETRSKTADSPLKDICKAMGGEP